MKRILIVGTNFGVGLANTRTLEILNKTPHTQVVANEDSKQLGLIESLKKECPLSKAITPLTLSPSNLNFENKGMSRRAARRKAERDAKKR